MSGVLITCEHASKDLPSEHIHLYDPDTLDSHAGWDPGALDLAQHLARSLDAPLFAGRWSRLLIDLNRSAHHRGRIPGKNKLSPEQCAALHHGVWLPYRQQVAEAAQQAVRGTGHCLHLSVHSFTPIWQGQMRRTDIGLLYDPARSVERHLAKQLQAALSAGTGLRVHRNQPYRGMADGHTTGLRRHFDEHVYAGLELEISQSLVQRPAWASLSTTLSALVADSVRSHRVRAC